jgi:hypothetical protein
MQTIELPLWKYWAMLIGCGYGLGSVVYIILNMVVVK